MKPIDVSRVKKTRCGHQVRIYATDGGKGKETIHGAVFTDERGWSQFSWFDSGRAYLSDPNHDYDLVEEPETVDVDVWLNVREDGSSVRWESREQADRNASNDRFACINIKRTVTKGEGLE